MFRHMPRLYPCHDISNRRCEVVGLGSTKFCVFAIAPLRRNSHDAVRTSSADVVGPVSDHDGVAATDVPDVERRANEIGLVTATLRRIGSVNGIEVMTDVQMTYDQPGGFDGPHGDDLKRVAGVTQRRQRFRDSGKHATLEDATFVK